MPTPYSGVTSAVQAPSPQPGEKQIPVLNIPTGGDRGGTLWSQAFKAAADWVAFIAASFPTTPRGTLLRVSVLTSGVAQARSSGCTRARIRMLGGGGGGAGADGLSGNSHGGGGAAGGYVEFFTTNIPTFWSFTIGAAGTAGAGTPTNGGNGGNTALADGVTTITAFGGGGGGFGPLGVQGAAPSVSTNGSINGSGEPGYGADTTDIVGGNGGSSALGGAGGVTQFLGSGINSGTPGTGPGAGGSGGSVIVGSGSATGGAGTGGMIVIEEYT